MEFSIQRFSEIKRSAQEFYSTIGSVYCPYFGEHVHFNTKGFDHFVFKEWNKARVTYDQFTRLRYIHLAPEVIREAKTLQGIWKTQKFERIKRNGVWIKILKTVSYYEFISIIDLCGTLTRVKVIIKQVDKGDKFFLSIIPFWGINKITGERIMYDGNPENEY
jgi:hypothetical protein